MHEYRYLECTIAQVLLVSMATEVMVSGAMYSALGKMVSSVSEISSEFCA